MAAAGAVSVAGTLAATLGTATAAATGKIDVQGTLAATLDAATLAATGTVASAVTGTLNVTLDAAVLAATGAVSVTGVLAATLADATLAGTGAVSVAGTLTTTLDVAALAATGAVSIAGVLSGHLDDVALVATGTVVGGGAAELIPLSTMLMMYLAASHSAKKPMRLRQSAQRGEESRRGPLRPERTTKRERRIAKERLVNLQTAQQMNAAERTRQRTIVINRWNNMRKAVRTKATLNRRRPPTSDE